MRLILIRHAEAVPVGEQGVSEDDQRPLTERGRCQCQQLVAALKRLGVMPDRLLTSSLLRARQTAEEVVAGLGGTLAIEECHGLVPGGKKRKVVTKLLQREVDVVFLVGHNPDLSELVGWFIGEKNASIDMDKAGMACIDFEGAPDKGNGVLMWMVTPQWYAALAG